MAIGHLTSDYVAFVFNVPIESVGMCAQLATWYIPQPYWQGIGSLAPSIYTQIPSSRPAPRRSNFWRVVSPAGGTFVITQRSSSDPNSYPTAPSVSLDTVMYFWNNNKTIQLAYDDDGGGLSTSRFTVTMTAGVQYLIECSSWNVASFSYKVQAYKAGGSDVTGAMITSI